MRRLLVSTALSLSMAVAPLLTVPAIAQQRLQPGATVQGDLSRGDDQLDSGEFLDVYEIQGRAGQSLSVAMRSGDFDTYLMLRGPGDFQRDNDDAGDDGTNAALDVRLPVDGIYYVTATSYEAGETGRYSLSMNGGGGATARPVAGRSVQNAGGGRLQAGRAAAGTLAQGDRVLESGEFSDDWELQVRRGQTYTVSLEAGDFDSYLMVRGPGGLSEDNDDDPAQRGGRNSRVTFTAAADGMVNVSATSFSSGETGRYQLLAQEGGRAPFAGAGRPPQPNYQPPTQQADGTIQVGQTVNGTLRQGDRRLDSGEYVNTYALRGRRGQQLDLRLSSSAFDPYLSIQGPGLSEFNDDDADGDGGTNSRLFVTLPSDGDYRITATSYAPGEVGGYRLAVNGGAQQGRPRQDSYVEERGQRQNVRGGNIAIGDTVSGTLQNGDVQLESGEYVDTFTFSAERGQRVAAELTSSAFDAYIILTTPSGEQIDNDDGEDGTNSRLDQVLAEDGEYQVMVTSYSPGETGSYRFSVTPSQGSPRQAAVQGGQRVFAIMVGVSDYGDAANDLPYTDEDAEKLAETLRRGGVLNPTSVVLTNAQATVGGVRRAFQEVAREAGPDDMFLFFFSGHGSQGDSQVSALEPDGRSETIVLRDGEITDHELADLFDGLNTRLSLLVLDSCYSGGFARNVVDRPGVMGLFSSEEDLTSAVADKFEAGGYLSHFLRSGLDGAGDGDGDGVVTAGELATYLRRQFVAEVENVEAETAEGQRNYQNLVIDRGGVQVDDVVLRLASNSSHAGSR